VVEALRIHESSGAYTLTSIATLVWSVFLFWGVKKYKKPFYSVTAAFRKKTGASFVCSPCGVIHFKRERAREREREREREVMGANSENEAGGLGWCRAACGGGAAAS